MAKRKRVALTSEWLANWKPKEQEEVSDRECKGLSVIGGPSGVKTFYCFENVRDSETGKPKRKRVPLGRWPAVSLADARKRLHDARETRQAETGAGDATVNALADAYRTRILSKRLPASAAWSWGIIRTHVLSAKPDPRRPPFNEWPARIVRPPDITKVIDAAMAERTVTVTGANGKEVARHVGGRAAALAALREVKAIFATAVGVGALEMSPAAVLQSDKLGLKRRRRGRKLSDDEVKTLFTALDLNALLDGSAKERKLSATVRLAIAFLLYAPVRSHSLVGAKWKELDLDAGRWVIPVARLKLNPDDREQASPFTVPIPSTGVAILRKLRELAGDSPWVLASPKNPKKHIGRKVLIRALARLQDSGRLAAGSRFTIHDLRRTWRSKAGELGVSFEVAEKSLAHVLPGVADTYARGELVEKRAEAAELVAADFDRIGLGKAAKVVPLAKRRA